MLKKRSFFISPKKISPGRGIEPRTNRLKAGHSTTELSRLTNDETPECWGFNAPPRGGAICLFSSSDIYLKKHKIEKLTATPKGKNTQKRRAVISGNEIMISNLKSRFQISAKFHFCANFVPILCKKFHWNQTFQISKLQVKYTWIENTTPSSEHQSN